eukprot:119117_1
MTDNCDDYMFYEEDYEEMSDWDEASDIDQDNHSTCESISLQNTTTQILIHSSLTKQNAQTTLNKSVTNTITTISTNCNYEINQHTNSSQNTNNENASDSIQHKQVKESIVLNNIERPNKSETTDMTIDVINNMYRTQSDAKTDKYGLSNEMVISLCKKKSKY